MFRMLTILSLSIATLAFPGICYSNITLPSILSDNMLLQQNAKVSIWGWTTEPSETIVVCGSWNKDTVRAEADQGKWRVNLQTGAAGGPFTIYIKGHQEIIIKNVLLGENWLCAGQSNMEMPVDSFAWDFPGVINFKEECAEANYPDIRFFQVLKQVADYPQDDCKGKWVVCTSQSVRDFSAVAYFFGREIHRTLKMPVGLIEDCWAGTNIETWMPAGIINSDSDYSRSIKNVQRKKMWPCLPGLAYNAMIYPLRFFRLAGVIWYQGESNKFNGDLYLRLFSDMIGSWRKDWNFLLPFYYVQISPYRYNLPSASAVREAQLETLRHVDLTGMVVTNDIGNLDLIHPRNKQEVGRRLSLCALAKTYNKPLVFSGPTVRSVAVHGNKMLIGFDHAEQGLEFRNNNYSGFEIAGIDGVFVKAKARIVKGLLVLSADSVASPKSARFACNDTDQPAFYNADGLPASCFRVNLP